jgi:RNA polymerase sigma-70 factor (ECF subfamily)
VTYPQVRAYVLRRTRNPQDAEDVVAATYLTAWRRLDTFLATDVPLAWLYRVAAGQLANQRRSTSRFTALQVRLFQVPPPDAGGDPGDRAVYGEQQDRIVAALAVLRPADQELLRLVAFEELTPSEIASAWGLPARLVRVRLHRARKRLQSALEHLGKGTDVGNGGPTAGHKQARPTRDGLDHRGPEQ